LVTWKRGFLEIIGEILQVLSEKPMKKSHISFKSNLDSRAVTKYLRIMNQIDLVKQDEKNSSEFTLTQKGVKFLENYLELVKMVKK